MDFIASTLPDLTHYSPLQKVNHPLLLTKGITLSIKRDDLIHPDISGNKWRKLKHNLIYAKENNRNQIITFGGAFSNHIHALAAAAYHLKLNTIGIIRGEAHYASNPTLSQAKKWGMQLQFVDRYNYRLKEEKSYLEKLQLDYPEAFIVPEGGSNKLAIPGVVEVIAELLQQCEQPIDHLFTATGSGGTLAGLISGALQYTPKTNIHGVAVLKDANYLGNKVSNMVSDISPARWQLHTQFHEGGYGKISQPLALFCQDFSRITNIPIEPIYTGKMLFALWQLITNDYFSPGSNIVALHTGGLQGLAGLKLMNKF